MLHHPPIKKTLDRINRIKRVFKRKDTKGTTSEARHRLKSVIGKDRKIREGQ